MQEFLTDVLESCDISTSLISPPVKVYTNVGIDHLKSTCIKVLVCTTVTTSLLHAGGATSSIWEAKFVVH